MSKMPTIDLSKTGLFLGSRDMEIARRCLGRMSSESEGLLRSSKPDPKRDGEAAYVWRMVAFQVSPHHAHHCMPMMAEFDLPAEFWTRRSDCAADTPEEQSRILLATSEKRKARIRELDLIVDAVVGTVPKDQWHGIHRWGQVLGAL